jgi:hypothetical protein
VSVGLVAGGLIVSMLMVAALVMRTQAKTVTAASSTINVAVVTTQPSDIAQLAPTTAAVTPSVTAAAAARSARSTLPESVLPESGLPTPQAAARNLWDAWRDEDRPRALLYAKRQAVTTLFGSRWTPQVREAGCTVTEAGWLCRFEGEKLRWDLFVEGSQGDGYRVRRIAVGDPVGDLIPPDTLPTAASLPTPGITRRDGSPAPTYGPPPPATAPGQVSSVEVSTTIDGSGSGETSTSRVKSAKSGKSSSKGSTSKKVKTTKVPKTTPEAPPDEAPPAPETPAPAPAAPPGTPEPVQAGDGAPGPVQVANPK